MTAFAPLTSTPLSAAPPGAILYLAAFESTQTATWAYGDIANGRNGFSATGYITSGTTTAGVPTSGSGNDAALYKVYLLSAATGEFQLTGNNIELLLSRRLLADSGAFTLTGNNATLIKTGGGGSSAADIWGYVLSNGMTAEEALVAVYTALHKEGGVLTVGKFLGLK